MADQTPTQLDRIEAKLDALLAILLDEDEPEGADGVALVTLDGAAIGADRDPGAPL